jgi:hypothetical protein
MEQTHCFIFTDKNYKIPTLKNFTRKIINRSNRRKEALRTRDTSPLNPPQSTPQVSEPDSKKYSLHICNFIFVINCSRRGKKKWLQGSASVINLKQSDSILYAFLVWSSFLLLGKSDGTRVWFAYRAAWQKHNRFYLTFSIYEW